MCSGPAWCSFVLPSFRLGVPSARAEPLAVCMFGAFAFTVVAHVLWLAAAVCPSVFSLLPLLPVHWRPPTVCPSSLCFLCFPYIGGCRPSVRLLFASSFAALFTFNQVFLIIAPSSLFQCLAPTLPFVISLDVALDHLSSTSLPGAVGETLEGAREGQTVSFCCALFSLHALH